MGAYPSSTAQVSNLKIQPHQGLFDDYKELIATWDWPYEKTKEFDVRWDYNLGGVRADLGPIWIQAKTETVPKFDQRQLSALYTPPDNAIGVRIKIKPIAKTHKVNGKEKAYWKISHYSKLVYHLSVRKKYITTPSAPTVEVKNYTAKVTVNHTDKMCSQVAIYVVDDSTKTIAGYGIVTLYYGRGTLSVNLQPNRTYRAYCVALVSSAYSSAYQNSEASAYSSDFETVPTTPTISSLISTSETSVDIVLAAVTNAESYEVQYAENQDYFDKSDAVNSKKIEVVKGSSTKKLYITGLETGKIWFFRIRGLNGAGSSPWSNISYITLGLKPNAPTIWSSTYTGVINDEVILYWTHNSLDSSLMTTSELLLKMSYMDEVTGDTIEVEEKVEVKNEEKKEDQNTFAYRFVPQDHISNFDGVVSKLEWSVRTKGILDEYSPYSITNIIEFFVKPDVILQFAKTNDWYWDDLDLETGNIYEAMGDFSDYYYDDPFILEGFPLYVIATVLPIYTRCVDAFFAIYAEETYEGLDYMGNNVWIPRGTEVYSTTMSAPNLEDHIYKLVVPPQEALLDNGIAYRFYARIITNNGMVTEMERYFTVEFEELDCTLNAEIAYDEENVSTHIEPYCVDDDGKPAEDILYLSVYRQNYDGEFVEIAKDLNNINGITVIDPHPTLRFVKYRLVATAMSGQVFYTDLGGYPIPETAIVLQWDESWSEYDLDVEDSYDEPMQKLSMLKLPFNVDTSESNTIDSELVEYIGRKYPVSYFGTQVGQKLSLSADIVADDTDTIYQLRRLATWLGNVYVREPSGHGYWATVAVSFSKTHLEMKIPVKLEITRVEGGV